MEEAIESWKHNKYDVRIYQDTSSDQSPNDYENHDLFLVGFHDQFSVERDGFEKYVAAQAYSDREKHLNEDLEEHEIERVKQVKKEYHIFGLEAYIHSGVALAIAKEGNFPDRRWDVSQLGAVFVSKRDWETRPKAKKAAEGLIKEWNHCLSGEIYGYTITENKKCKTCSHVATEEVDSCWGFVGDFSQCREEAMAAANAL